MELSRDELDELVEKKVQQELARRTQSETDDENYTHRSGTQEMGRRHFLKRAGGGAGILGAAAMFASSEAGAAPAASQNADARDLSAFLEPMGDTAGVVAPSDKKAYSTIQEAIDAGCREIFLAEKVEEGNIRLKQNGTRITGWGNGTYQTIVDPQDGRPVFGLDTELRHVTIANIRIEGGSKSGPAIDTRTPGPPGASLWEVRRCLVDAGPIIMLGPRNQLRHVTVNARHDTPFSWLPGADYKTKAALIVNGATYGIMGGSYSNKNDGVEAVFCSGAAGTITGGTTISNAGGGKDGTKRDLTLVGAARTLIGPCSFESSKEYNMQWGLAPSHAGLKNAVITASGFNPLGGDHKDAGFSKIRCEGGASSNVTMISPHGNIKFDLCTESHPNVHATVYSSHKVVSEGNRPMFINHVKQGVRGNRLLGGDRDSPSTAVGFQIHSSKPKFPEDGVMAIADGTNWDIQGNGNAAKVIYNGEEWIVDTDLGRSL